MTTSTVPTIPADIASVLHLGCKLIPIGYWRTRQEGGGSPYHRSLETARAGLTNTRGGSINGMSYREYYTAEIPKLEAKVEAWDRLPWPGDYIDPSISADERERVAAALDRAPVIASYMGSSGDRLASGEERRRPLGSSERSAAGYCWPDGLSHYVRMYGLRLPADFLAAIGASEPTSIETHAGPFVPGSGPSGLQPAPAAAKVNTFGDRCL